ncbi:hypothetical protein D0T66_14290 [Dysgonomonas sp. 25]|nr:hypothetical protein [Dysgonomonas sp. 25]
MNCSFAQKTEKSFNGETYIIENNYIYNKKDNIYKQELSNCEYYRAEEISSLRTIIDGILSKDKKESLSGKRLTLLLLLDKNGLIKEVRFRIPPKEDSPSDLSISIEEIYKLEQQLKKYQFKLTSDCPDIEYYRFNWSYKF